MAMLLRNASLLGGLALLSACGGGDKTENMASLDARLTNGAATQAGAMGNDTAGNAGAPAQIAEGSDTTSVAQTAGATFGPGASGAAALAASIGGSCADIVQYGNDWAGRMPAPFALYPGAALSEAAGSDKAGCRLRVISFKSADKPDAIVTHYAARARGAGYDAERQVDQGEVQLGGTRASDGAAFIIFVRPDGKGSDVDVVASPD